MKENKFGMAFDLKTIVFAAGGTGGHVSPAVAIAEAFDHDPKIRSVIFGSNRQGETLIEFPGDRVDIGPPRWRSPHVIDFFWSLIKCVTRVKKLFRDFQASAVVATGGYVCLPTLLAARLSGLPYWLLEQNQIPGRVVRWFSSGAQKTFGPLFTSFEGIEPVGVPVRRAIRESRRKPSDHCTILVSGGSQGSEVLDRRLPSLLTKLSQKMSLKVIHICRQETQQLEYGADVDWMSVTPGSHFAQWLAQADVVIGRAGGSTLAECNALGVAQVLIPFSLAADNHQWHNAKVQAESGAALVLQENELDATWEAQLASFLKPESLNRAKQAAQSLDRTELADQLASSIVQRLRAS